MKFYEIKDFLYDLRAINIIIGGRGIGKTYSTLNFLIEHSEPFIYLRNTDIQLDECTGEFGNPFKKLNKDKGYDIHLARNKKHSVILDMKNDNKVLGYGIALSTFENLRGVDLSEIKYVVFDEFIENRKLTFDQFKTFQNFYETVNRNRELMGEDPLICILLSNSQSLNNPILIGYNIVGIIEGMIKAGQQKYKNPGMFINLPESEISELKKKTVNYKMLKGTRIYEENLNNKFANDSFYGIKSRSIREYKPLVKIDDIYIYKHKSNGKFYCCFIQSLNIPEYTSKDNMLVFYRMYGNALIMNYAAGNVEFSDFTVKSKLMEILK